MFPTVSRGRDVFHRLIPRFQPDNLFRLQGRDVVRALQGRDVLHALHEPMRGEVACDIQRVCLRGSGAQRPNKL